MGKVRGHVRKGRFVRSHSRRARGVGRVAKLRVGQSTSVDGVRVLNAGARYTVRGGGGSRKTARTPEAAAAIARGLGPKGRRKRST